MISTWEHFVLNYSQSQIRPDQREGNGRIGKLATKGAKAFSTSQPFFVCLFFPEDVLILGSNSRQKKEKKIRCPEYVTYHIH